MRGEEILADEAKQQQQQQQLGGGRLTHEM
jgi:hypothetical protein